MVLNYIWIFFFAVAFIVALFRLVIGGDTEVFSAMMTSTFDMSKTGFPGADRSADFVDGDHENR